MNGEAGLAQHLLLDRVRRGGGALVIQSRGTKKELSM